MLLSTLEALRCPKQMARTRAEQNGRCHGDLTLRPQGGAPARDVVSGTVECLKCRAQYPILGGVLVLVADVGSYLLQHVKGISKHVPDSEIPAKFRGEYLEAKEEIEQEHIEEDLEAERVISLYLANHYLDTSGASWWQPGSPLMDSLIREHWDRGPFFEIEKWFARGGRGEKEATKSTPGSSLKSVVELGCGVGGLFRKLSRHTDRYLGIDSSFASIALARHLNLGAPYSGKTRIPEDLLRGPVTRDVKIAAPAQSGCQADWIVADLDYPPLEHERWDCTIALNTIDMLDEPTDLPKLQASLLKKGGVAIQSCPYIWHEAVAKKIRSRLPKDVRDSAGAVEWMYEKVGFSIQEKVDQLPWLFFKHLRQLEIYSVHMFFAVKP